MSKPQAGLNVTAGIMNSFCSLTILAQSCLPVAINATSSIVIVHSSSYTDTRTEADFSYREDVQSNGISVVSASEYYWSRQQDS